MASKLPHLLRKLSYVPSLFIPHLSSINPPSFSTSRSILGQYPFLSSYSSSLTPPLSLSSPGFGSWPFSWGFKFMSHGSVRVVLSGGTPKFEAQEMEPPKKEKWKTKKRLKDMRKREKGKRKMASKTDPRRLTPKGKKKKNKFPDAEERIKNKIEQVM
ncbi:uncharacterized protein LOC110007894 isoform X1 [Amborella trichopoda]|uniref:uncharacterized protein LOC110007894 isoform X1 n=1 Tax=Amborella trichopoda TaxID=13333 RepID=UPI0009BD4452|nr:uncharacterized protein LOC110007894 isoform X1 [Amborella trichopoda]XP_020527555.1 uncharacterized protein LOC110007894 isoform X1 [Amborella trichopoda]|eukprot:XP_020527553.1 uncharacterized protein LOC110007894 isoform X1 [Amborella trichopoda]